VVSFAPDFCVPRPRRTASFATSVVRGSAPGKTPRRVRCGR